MMAQEIATTRDERQWIRKRHKQRHDCADHLPAEVPADVDVDDAWRCPKCHRRWQLAMKGESLMALAEGVSIDGPDGSTYWRPFRTRFIGRIWL